MPPYCSSQVPGSSPLAKGGVFDDASYHQTAHDGHAPGDANVLTLSGRREVLKDEENEKYVWHEREEGRFMRSMRLPTTVAEDKIKGSVDHGVLVVHLPKAEPAVKSKILIK